MINKLYYLINKLYYLIVDKLLSIIINQKKEVIHNGIKMKFHTSNSLMKYRVDSFSNKEPETLEWMDNFKEKSIFWDIGANVGLYSIYSTLKSNCKVFSFEPSFFNLEFLSRNIFLNKLQNNISVIPVALNDKNSMSKFQLNNTNWSGALSTFEKKIDQYGKDFSMEFEYSTPGLSGKEIKTIFDIPQPNYIKIDVDGIEHYILKGLIPIIKNTKEILIETNQNLKSQKDEINQILKKNNFRIKKICKKGFENTPFRNEIWIKAKN